MWTDEQLADSQDVCTKGANGALREGKLREAELYRLARLGLAAETVGKELWEDVAEEYSGMNYMSPLFVFLRSPAWRRE